MPHFKDCSPSEQSYIIYIIYCTVANDRVQTTQFNLGQQLGRGVSFDAEHSLFLFNLT